MNFFVYLTKDFDEFLITVKVPFGRYITYSNLENVEIELEISGDETEFKPLMDMIGIGLSELEQGEEISSFTLIGDCDKDMASMLIGCITLKVINRELNILLEDIAKEMEY